MSDLPYKRRIQLTVVIDVCTDPISNDIDDQHKCNDLAIDALCKRFIKSNFGLPFGEGFSPNIGSYEFEFVDSEKPKLEIVSEEPLLVK